MFLRDDVILVCVHTFGFLAIDLCVLKLCVSVCLAFCCHCVLVSDGPRGELWTAVPVVTLSYSTQSCLTPSASYPLHGYLSQSSFQAPDFGICIPKRFITQKVDYPLFHGNKKKQKKTKHLQNTLNN